MSMWLHLNMRIRELFFVVVVTAVFSILLVTRTHYPFTQQLNHENYYPMRMESVSRNSTAAIRSTRAKPRALTSKQEGRFVITFLGDTMLANCAYNWEFRQFGSKRKIGEGFEGVKHLLEKSDFKIINLEGPITMLPITRDLRPRKTFNYSFGMDPLVTSVFQELKIDAANLANNHLSDRGVEGYWETQRHLTQAGIQFFGAGFTEQERAEPLMLDTPQGKVGITGFQQAGYCCDELPNDKGEKTHLTLRPNPDNAALALSRLQELGATIKIAFAHWGSNYSPTLRSKVRHMAEKLVDYDLIIGSSGSHTVKEFDFVDDTTPALYDIGNFVFMKPSVNDGLQSMPWGTVTHLILEDGQMKELEIYCTIVDNAIVNFKPRECTPKEASQLFATMGPHLKYKQGNTFATANLQLATKKTKTQ